jgi:hypothetical protein
MRVRRTLAQHPPLSRNDNACCRAERHRNHSHAAWVQPRCLLWNMVLDRQSLLFRGQPIRPSPNAYDYKYSQSKNFPKFCLRLFPLERAFGLSRAAYRAAYPTANVALERVTGELCKRLAFATGKLHLCGWYHRTCLCLSSSCLPVPSFCS